MLSETRLAEFDLVWFIMVQYLLQCRGDILGSYLFLHYLFRVVLALSFMFDHILIKETLKRESGQKFSIIKQCESLWRDMKNYGHKRHRISNTYQFSTRAIEKATYGF